jgi:hypothetical protein
MQGQIESVISATTFVPSSEGAGAGAYMYNCSGTLDPSIPDRQDAGHYRIYSPVAVDHQKISVTARAFNSDSNVNFIVTVVPEDLAAGFVFDVPTTIYHIYIRLDDGTATDDAELVQVNIARMPL